MFVKFFSLFFYFFNDDSDNNVYYENAMVGATGELHCTIETST